MTWSFRDLSVGMDGTPPIVTSREMGELLCVENGGK